MRGIAVNVAGVDGYTGGWVAVVMDENGFTGASCYRKFEELLLETDGVQALAVDIPIGLPDDGTRAADRLARQVLGRGASSVFFTPPRSVLKAGSFDMANQVSRNLGRGGVSRQSFALSNKILEVEPHAKADPRIFEVHPEVSFRQMATLLGTTLRASKKSWSGFYQRRSLLTQHEIVIPDDLGQAGAAGLDDVLDAAAAAWSARRRILGIAQSLPEVPELLDGYPCAIWY